MKNNQREFNILDFGANANHSEDQTGHFQECIEECRRAGGGQIIVPSGIYTIGSIRLYSNMTLYLESGAVIRGSKNYQDYQDFQVPTTIQYLTDKIYVELWNLPDYYFYAMITAFEAENIQIIGEPGSIIDGQDTVDLNGEEKFRGPMGIIMSSVKNLHLEGYLFQNSANWSHTLDGCENITIENVCIKAGHDGFNLHHSTNISVSNCRLETGDDCFAGYDIENLRVENCYLNTACNSMRIGGTAIDFINCVFTGPGKYPHLSKGTHHTHAIFKYYAIRPDTMRSEAQNIKIERCMISDADRLFSYDQGKEELNQNNVPLRDLILENVNISKIRHTSIFKGNGQKGKLMLKNIQIDWTSEEAFIEIDDAIELTLENVEFINAAKIVLSANKELIVHGRVSLELNTK